MKRTSAILEREVKRPKTHASKTEREEFILQVIGAVGHLFLEHTSEVNAKAKKIKKKLIYLISSIIFIFRKIQQF